MGNIDHIAIKNRLVLNDIPYFNARGSGGYTYEESEHPWAKYNNFAVIISIFRTAISKSAVDGGNDELVRFFVYQISSMETPMQCVSGGRYLTREEVYRRTNADKNGAWIFPKQGQIARGLDEYLEVSPGCWEVLPLGYPRRSGHWDWIEITPMN